MLSLYHLALSGGSVLCFPSDSNRRQVAYTPYKAWSLSNEVITSSSKTALCHVRHLSHITANNSKFSLAFGFSLRTVRRCPWSEIPFRKDICHIYGSLSWTGCSATLSPGQCVSWGGNGVHAEWMGTYRQTRSQISPSPWDFLSLHYSSGTALSISVWES